MGLLSMTSNIFIVRNRIGYNEDGPIIDDLQIFNFSQIVPREKIILVYEALISDRNGDICNLNGLPLVDLLFKIPRVI